MRRERERERERDRERKRDRARDESTAGGCNTTHHVKALADEVATGGRPPNFRGGTLVPELVDKTLVGNLAGGPLGGKPCTGPHSFSWVLPTTV
jgi:hypothetical protein